MEAFKPCAKDILDLHNQFGRVRARLVYIQSPLEVLKSKEEGDVQSRKSGGQEPISLRTFCSFREPTLPSYPNNIQQTCLEIGHRLSGYVEVAVVSQMSLMPAGCKIAAQKISRHMRHKPHGLLPRDGHLTY